MNWMQALFNASSLVIVGLVFIAIYFHQAMKRLAAEHAATEKLLNEEIRRQELLRNVERRAQVALPRDYALEEVEALEMIRDSDILRDVIATGLRPVVTTRHDLSSDPEADWADDEYVSISCTLDSRIEEAELESDRKLVRITETSRCRAVTEPHPAFPGAGSSWNPRDKRIVWEIILSG